MADVLHLKRYPLAAAMMAAAIGVFVFVQARQRGSQAPPAPTAWSGDDHGRSAATPEAIPLSGVRDVFWRVFHEILDDRVTLIAAGVTFYLLLAIFPALAALVSLYGLVADPVTISEHLRELAILLPPGAFDLLADQIKALVEKRESTLGITFFIGLAIALWSTHSGTLAIFDAMNVAYEEREKRSLFRLNLIGLCFTLCAMVFAVVMVALVGVMPVVLSYLWLDQFKENVALLLRWPLLLFVVAMAVTLVYRFGPSREPARVRWMTWGAGLTTFAWAAMSVGFSFYLEHFANYNATYGTLGALIGFLVWIWLSVVILILGAELNAELEHQTAKDTTTGPPLPMGARGAYVADTLGETVS
ncbi:YihY/virulence factor BrkB family protein [Rhizobium lentis]|uniref:YihY/virulence factor BrkB family protein n=1 Tax=Rhizobium lentis TaxID=1138194 RepID=UPI001C82D5A3|nr:YihY/virulence factor BrkB family protein [Rhizobium lentis]MBX5038954.1 YihY/virulence factor BrkB family protein [Rhizobium lentis]MBX5056295.1 YihY/virulence factor BrkB family protein [Rhizobium lentis]MBX5069808.1 YihY/virulence factor BrkB family protein [Rhizobium lentis]MBX5111211.1 YihY/virulence factor BrkB family protein [Rhizobium lentis]MBX5114500.1 YihY/virulence factor BrkB family protein [Rhizobium lentis]